MQIRLGIAAEREIDDLGRDLSFTALHFVGNLFGLQDPRCSVSCGKICRLTSATSRQ
jgi:hypothetical protein